MDAPQFVAVDDRTWVQVSHIVAVVDVEGGCRIYTTEGQRSEFDAGVPAKDFLARVVSVR